MDTRQEPNIFLVFDNKGLGSKPRTLWYAVWVRIDYMLTSIYATYS